MKRYDDCIRGDGMCGICSSSSHGQDCHGNQINKLMYYRTTAGIPQATLAEKSGINIRTIQKYEKSEYDIGNMTLRTAKALSASLGINIEDLL